MSIHTNEPQTAVHPWYKKKRVIIPAGLVALDMSGFSKKGLIEQLSSAAGEGFTPAQARYAANKVY
jgi:hypothetical protein